MAKKHSKQLLVSMICLALLDWLSDNQEIKKGFAVLGTLMMVENSLPCCIGCQLQACGAISYGCIISVLKTYAMICERSVSSRLHLLEKIQSLYC